MEKFKRTIAPDARPICGRIALHQRLRAQSHDLEIAIYLRVTSKYLPVIGAKIPVNLTREFASERPVSTGLDHPADAKKKAEIGEFALLIPVTPHFRPETGSQQTAPTARAHPSGVQSISCHPIADRVGDGLTWRAYAAFRRNWLTLSHTAETRK